MAKRKKGKIAGKPINKWIEAKIPRAAAPKHESRLKYSNKLIAFLDVLGIKRLIDNHKNGKEHKAIYKVKQIRKIIDSSAEIVKKDFKIDYLNISDSFVFVSEPETIIPLLKLLSIIQTRVINECLFLLRGAITIGDAMSEEGVRFIIGPAYIKAYQLQENDAIYPRIIADNSIIDEIKKYREPISKYLQRDLDKEHFIDYIKVFMEHESLSEEDMKIRLRRNMVFEELKRCYKKYNKTEEHNICQKYGWTIQYYKKKGVW